LEKYEFLDDPTAVIESLRSGRVRVDLFTFLQRLPESILSKALPKFDYPMEWDNLAVLPVSTFDHWWNHQIRSVPRNRARQAEKKGVNVREVPFDDTLVKGIWEIYNECAVRQGVKFLHYGRNMDWVRVHAGTFLDRSIFIGAFLGERLIGFIKLVADSARTQACTMHILSMVQHREKSPTNALIAQAVRSCADRSIRYLVYQNFSYGKKQGDSLSQFKEVNGFQRVDLPRYYVPLTAIGQVAFRLGLHRRLVDRLPQSLGAKLREFRKTWYHRKFRLATGA
jgi:hypothetical protein